MKCLIVPASLLVVVAILASTLSAQVHSSSRENATLPFLTITPSGPVTMDAGSTRQFVANGDSSREAGVNWQINADRCPENDCGTISADGLYRAPASVTDFLEVTVLARSNVPPFVTSSEEIVIVARTGKLRRAPCTSAQPGYCRLEWQVHQMFSPYLW